MLELKISKGTEGERDSKPSVFHAGYLALLSSTFQLVRHLVVPCNYMVCGYFFP